MPFVYLADIVSSLLQSIHKLKVMSNKKEISVDSAGQIVANCFAILTMTNLANFRIPHDLT